MSKKITIYLAGLALTLFIATCGTEPPPAMWSGTPEDSTEVDGLIAANASYFVSDGFPFAKDSMKLAKPLYDSMQRVPLLERVFGLDSVAVRYIADSLGLEMKRTSRNQRFQFTRDTTVTVTVFDSFEVDMNYHAAKVCSLFYFKDTCSISNPYKPVLDSVNSWPANINLTKSFKRSVARTYLFFDSVGGAWRLAKFTPTIINFPSVDSAPQINQVRFTLYGSTRIDTIRYSTTDNKLKAMNILRPLDSVLTYKPGDSIQIFVRTDYDGQNADAGYYIFYGHLGSIHDHLEEDYGPLVGSIQYNGIFYVKFDTPGYKRLYVQVVDTRSFYVSNQQNTKKDFYSTIWVIPIRVQ